MTNQRKEAKCCIRGHRVQAPNIVETTGVCWVCQTAEVHIGYHPSLSLDDVAERLYSELVANKAQERVYVAA